MPINASTSKWLTSGNILLLWSYTQPSASAGRAWTDVQPAFLLRRDRGAQAGAGSPEQMTGRCTRATASRRHAPFPPCSSPCTSPALGGHRSALTGSGEQPHLRHANITSHLHRLLAPSSIPYARKWKLLNSGVNVHFDQHKLGRKMSVDTRNIYFPLSVISYLWLSQRCQFAWYFGRALLPSLLI